MINFSKQTLLVIAPHPDDEILGCGGLMKRIKNEGGKIYVLFVTVGDTQEYSVSGLSSSLQRVAEIEAVAKFYKYDNYKIIFQGDQYHLQMDSIPRKEIIAQIENGSDISLNTIKPTIVATPSWIDYNQDHTCATKAVLAATRPAPEKLKPLAQIVLGYEGVPTAHWWNIPPNINTFVPLSDDELQAKIAALKLYASQIRPFNHPRSLAAMKNLASYRGMFSGSKAAEAFICYRQIL